MNAYVYQAALLCEDCANSAREAIRKAHPSMNVEAADSDYWPRGPYPDGGGEADSPRHCDTCGVFLENWLTPEGWNYTEQCIEDYCISHGKMGTRDVLIKWFLHYGSELWPNNPDLRHFIGDVLAGSRQS